MNKSPIEKKKRYLDVMTLRPSGAAFGRNSEPHTALAVEPVVIADLEHLSVDDSIGCAMTVRFIRRDIRIRT